MKKRNFLYALVFALAAVVFSPMANANPLSLLIKDYSKTKYPIVMVHGAFGFDSILGVIDYWYFITSNMRLRGAQVYVVNMSSAALHEKRGEELRDDIRQILAISGAQKVNLIAHSQGATASRYVAALEPQWIASVSCAHCMNEGTQFADGFTDFLNALGIGAPIVDGAVTLLLELLELISGPGSDGGYNSELNVDQSMLALAAASKHDPSYTTFNAQYPAAMPAYKCWNNDNGRSGPGATLAQASGASVANGIRWYSWGGETPITNMIDPFDLIVIPLAREFTGSAPLKWDGLVPSCGMALGEALRLNYKANHFDAINHALAITAFGMNIPSIYYNHANRLKKAGL